MTLVLSKGEIGRDVGSAQFCAETDQGGDDKAVEAGVRIDKRNLIGRRTLFSLLAAFGLKT